MDTDEGCSSIAEQVTGKLLFYTDGTKVWDRNHNQMPATISTPLNGHYSSTQSAVIVPLPNSSTIYYIFTTGAQLSYSDGSPSMCYSIVDLSLNSGNGDLLSINNVLIDSTTEKIAVTAAGCNSFWIVGHRWNCDSFYAFKLTSSGLSAIVKSKVGVVHQDVLNEGYKFESLGYMKFSSDGRKLGLVTNGPLNTMQLFDFNITTGEISNPLTDVFPYDILRPNCGLYGCSFSPDNSKFYVSYTAYTSYIFQYDMKANDIIGSRKLIAAGEDEFGGALQNGPDGRMYYTKKTPSSTTLDVITHPNALGLACNYLANAQPINGTSTFGLPETVENFFSRHIALFSLPSDTNICTGDTLKAPQSVKNNFSISPASYSINKDSSVVSFFPDNTTTYKIVNSNECGFRNTLYLTINVIPNPVAKFVFSPVSATTDDAKITLVNQSENGHYCTWNYGATKICDSPNCTVPNGNAGTFCYTLVAYNVLNCADTFTDCIKVLQSSNSINTESRISIPNAFTPNGDGRNDGFKALLFMPYLSYSISVYNRYGEQMFFSNKPELIWDGTFNNVKQEIGVYYYLIRVKFYNLDGREELYKGNISLIR